MADRKNIHIFGGGTVSHIRNHLALSAPAYGMTSRRLWELCHWQIPEMDTRLYVSRMAGRSLPLANFEGGGLGDTVGVRFETVEELGEVLDGVIEDPLTKIVFFTCAIPNFKGSPIRIHDVDGYSCNEWVFTDVDGEDGKHGQRIPTNSSDIFIKLTSEKKLISKIRKERKDIFLVAFKTTCGATEDEQYLAGLNLLKESSCNLVLANDVETRLNMIITPEEARYHVTHDRDEALRNLVEMAEMRSHLTFTRSTVVDADPVKWSDDRIPDSLRSVVEFCIERNAYKPFRGSTVGHFACKVDDNLFITSKRKTNFNDLKKNGMVLIKTDGPDTVLAYGAKPSVGGQSQRIVFRDHPGMDCIVHFHCPLRSDSKVPVRSQREFECGSHECGKNTSDGLGVFGNLYAVFLENHGPNIVFNRNIDPQEVIDFIVENFDLSAKTGGYVSNV